jgi:hypothetical protein
MADEETLDDFFEFDEEEDLDLDGAFDEEDTETDTVADETVVSDETADEPTGDNSTGEDDLEGATTENGTEDSVGDDAVADESVEDDSETEDTEDGPSAGDTVEEDGQEIDPDTGEVVDEDLDFGDDFDVDWDPDEEEEMIEAMEEEGDSGLPRAVERALNREGVNAKEFEVEEAERLLEEAESEFRKHQNEIMLLRWRQGLIAYATPKKYGESTMDKLAEATGVHKNTLYDAANVVEEFLFSRELYEEWLEEGEGGTRYWSEALDMIRKETDSTTDPTGDEEEFIDRVLDDIEELAHKIEQVNEMIDDLGDDVDEEKRREVEGLSKRAVAEARRFMKSEFYRNGEVTDAGQPIPRSEQYMDFIRDCPCAISEKPGADPHHVEQGGVGTKGSDFSAVPLHRKLHDELEDMPDEDFEAKYNVDFNELRYAYNHRFLTGQFPEHIDLPEPEYG